MPDIIDCRHDRSGQVVSEAPAERVSVQLLLDLSALLAAHGARLVLLLDRHVLADAGNALFELLEEITDGCNRGNRAVSVVVGQIRRFQIGHLADFVFICPAVFLAGRMAVLLEQTGNLEALPERREMLDFFQAERTDALGTEDKAGNLHQMADEREQTLAGKGNGLVAQNGGGNIRVVALGVGNADNIAVRAVDGRGIDEIHRRGRVMHQVIDVTERTIFRLGKIVLQNIPFA